MSKSEPSEEEALRLAEKAGVEIPSDWGAQVLNLGLCPHCKADLRESLRQFANQTHYWRPVLKDGELEFEYDEKLSACDPSELQGDEYICLECDSILNLTEEQVSEILKGEKP